MRRVATGLGLVVALGLAACTTVKPWQRADLSRQSMIDDKGPGQARFDAHARSAREAADGGGGEAGGGCGCN
jgi:hypothetical protein